MTENNAAKILETIRSAGYRDHPTNIERKRVDAILSAVEPLLTKLRAPVADERSACPTDVCQAAKADGVLCANDECDRASGVRLASAPVAGEAFMYGVMGPDGKAYLDEFCVSTDPAELEQEVVVPMNEEHGEGKYAVVALFRDAAPQASEAVRDDMGVPMPEVMHRPDWLRGYADTCELQARSRSHGTLYSTAKALRDIAAWLESSAALSAQPGAQNDA